MLPPFIIIIPQRRQATKQRTEKNIKNVFVHRTPPYEVVNQPQGGG